MNTDSSPLHAASGSLPLSMLGQGERARLLKVNASEGINSRLNALGLTPGVEVTIIQASGGPILLAVRNSRLALGRGMAQKIIVEMIEQD